MRKKDFVKRERNLLEKQREAGIYRRQRSKETQNTEKQRWRERLEAETKTGTFLGMVHFF